MIPRRTFIGATLATAAAASLPRDSFGAQAGVKLFDTHAHFYTCEL
jgi:hypothetical protein